jgi:hypothetical protein
MSSNIYDILNKFSSLEQQPEPKVEQKPQVKSKLQESIDSLSEKWAGDAEVKQTGQYADKTTGELKKMLGSLHKSGPHKRGSAEDKKQKQINFALRAKGGWKKGEGAAMKEEGVAEGSGDKPIEQMSRSELIDYLGMSREDAADMTNNDLRDMANDQAGDYDEDDGQPSSYEEYQDLHGGDDSDYGDLDEKAPPGAKAERMVKHIKAGYAKDGKLTDKERSIAYATAWKAHKAGKVEEAVQALRTLVDAGMTQQQITEGWDDMLKAVEKKHRQDKEEKGTGKFDKKKISTGTVYTRKYDADGMSNTDDEVKPEGEKRKRGRPKKNAFESKSTAEKMIAEAYTAEGGPQLVDIPAYQRKASGQNFPIEIADLEPKGVISSKQGLADLKDKLGMQEEDEVSAREPEDMKEDSQLSYEQDLLKKGVGDQMYNEIEAGMQDSNFNLTANEPLYHALYDYYTDNGEMPYDVAKARTGTPDEWIINKMQELFGNTDQEQQRPEDSNMDKELEEMMRLAGMQVETKMSEDDMEEGNKFSGELEKAKSAGKKEFEVDGKTYRVTEGEECPKCHCDPCECDDEDKDKVDECGPGYEMDQGQEGRMNVSTNMSSDGNKSVTITADGEAAEELMQMLALAGMKAKQPMPQEENVHQQMAAVEEEKDPRYQANTTPEEEVMPVQTQTKGGNGEVAGQEKKMHKDGAARFSDNPLAMKEEVEDLGNMGMDLMKEYEALKVQK